MHALFISAPYPGDLKFTGQPTGLLYALSVVAERKRREHGSRAGAAEEIEVWCPDGVVDFDRSELRERIRARVAERGTRIVGVSTFSISYKNALKIRDLVKSLSQDIVV